jgi:hypothetical protein
MYIYGELYAVKWRNWKYHLIWLDDMAKTPAATARTLFVQSPFGPEGRNERDDRQ